MDELFGFIPGGPWAVGAVALLAVPGVRRSLRPLAKSAIKISLGAVDQVKSLTAEAREQASDLVAEAKAERIENVGDAQIVTPVSSRARTAPTLSTTP